jgi:hypothetical protein
MNHATEHILKQVEWFEKLRSAYDCTFVELEHRFLGSHFRADVYGKTQNGEVYIVEVGRINMNELKALKRFSGRAKHVKLILVSPLLQKCTKAEKEQFAKFSSYTWVKVIP